MKFCFALSVSVTAALLAGCATPTQPSPEETRVNRLIKNCTNADGLDRLRNKCVMTVLHESPEVKAKARKILEGKIDALGPDFKLLFAIWEDNATGVTNALSLGANVNRVFTSVDIHGPDIGVDYSETTTPAFEAQDPKIFEALVIAGANLHWVQPYQGKSIIARRFHEGTPVDGLGLSAIALKFGYSPSAEDLVYIKQYAESRTKLKDREKYLDFYKKTLSFTSKKEKSRIAVIEAEIKASDARKEDEHTEKEKKEKAQSDAATAIAQASLNSRMLSVGVVGNKVCTQSNTGDVYIGNVVAVADHKIEVYITSAFPAGRPDLNLPGFRPYKVWESVNYWNACN